MFTLEIGFQDGVSQPEMILIRRPQALIGASDYAHVVVDDMQDCGFQLRLVRDLGRSFRCKLVGNGKVSLPAIDEGPHEGEKTLDFGIVRFHISVLDVDLMMKSGEPPDKAGVRVLRRAASLPSPLFPAVVVRGAVPMIVSFVEDQPVLIGRSNECPLRLDSSDISARHARMGYENEQFWIEDLGSTNGTFVDGQQISGRVSLAPGVPVVLGREIGVFGVTSESQLERAQSLPSTSVVRPSEEQRFPVLISVSEVARPARLVVQSGATVNIGRDPRNEIWLGAPHISRKHCSVQFSESEELLVNDHSTNGTGYEGGLLKKGDTLKIKSDPHVFDFGGGVTVALCFDEEEENAFVASHGSKSTFMTPEAVKERGIKKIDSQGLLVGKTSDSAFFSRTASLIQEVVNFFMSFSLLGRVALITIITCALAIVILVLHLVWSIIF